MSYLVISWHVPSDKRSRFQQKMMPRGLFTKNGMLKIYDKSWRKTKFKNLLRVGKSKKFTPRVSFEKKLSIINVLTNNCGPIWIVVLGDKTASSLTEEFRCPELSKCIFRFKIFEQNSGSVVSEAATVFYPSDLSDLTLQAWTFIAGNLRIVRPLLCWKCEHKKVLHDRCCSQSLLNAIVFFIWGIF